MSKKGKKIELDIIHSKAAGIDIGSKFHFVSVGQDLEKDVREFGVYTEDLVALRKWLQERDIETVAMESTGDYWQNLHSQLLEDGIEVVLVNGKFTKTTCLI